MEEAEQDPNRVVEKRPDGGKLSSMRSECSVSFCDPSHFAPGKVQNVGPDITDMRLRDVAGLARQILSPKQIKQKGRA